MTTRIRYLARPIVDPAVTPGLTLNLENIESGSAKIIGDLCILPPDGQNRFEPGDVLFSKLRPYLAKSLLVDRSLQGTGELLCLRPSEHVDARFLKYVTLSLPWLEWAVMTSYGTKMPRTSWEEMSNFRVPEMSTSVQRRIADFLDDRVSRIDKIVEARRSQQRLLKALIESELQHLLTSEPSIERPLQALTDPYRPIQYGIVQPGHDYPGGVPIIKGGDIGSGRLERAELSCTDPEIERRYRRSRVFPGDIVIAIRGSVGEVAFVPTAVEQANLTQDSARIAPDGCDANWLLAALSSLETQSEIERRVTGATIKGINIRDLRRVPISVPEQSAQRRIGQAAKALRRAAGSQAAMLHRSISLLTEYKSSLITAAVTDELDVTTAGSNIPG